MSDNNPSSFFLKKIVALYIVFSWVFLPQFKYIAPLFLLLYFFYHGKFIFNLYAGVYCVFLLMILFFVSRDLFLSGDIRYSSSAWIWSAVFFPFLLFDKSHIDFKIIANYFLVLIFLSSVAIFYNFIYGLSFVGQFINVSTDNKGVISFHAREQLSGLSLAFSIAFYSLFSMSHNDSKKYFISLTLCASVVALLLVGSLTAFFVGIFSLIVYFYRAINLYFLIFIVISLSFSLELFFQYYLGFVSGRGDDFSAIQYTRLLLGWDWVVNKLFNNNSRLDLLYISFAVMEDSLFGATHSDFTFENASPHSIVGELFAYFGIFGIWFMLLNFLLLLLKINALRANVIFFIVFLFALSFLNSGSLTMPFVATYLLLFHYFDV